MKGEKCFGMGKAGDCCVLCVRRCPGYAQCGFYKPRWRFERDQQLVNVRLRSLPRAQQAHIAEKYFGGKMAWKGGK